MEGLILKPGGVLENTREAYDKFTGKNELVVLDVSDHASTFLFDVVLLDGDLQLKDLFLLMERDPILFDVYRRYPIRELFEKAKLRNAQPFSGNCDSIGIQYLELSLWTEFDDIRKANYYVPQVDMQSICWDLQERAMVDGCRYFRMGRRVRGSLCDLSLNALLDLPLRLNESILCERNRHEVPVAIDTSENVFVKFTLGQVLDGVFRDLSIASSQKGAEGTRSTHTSLAEAQLN